MTLWSGRVASELAPTVAAFLRAPDAELLPYDLEGTLLHARRLEAAGILTSTELAEVSERLARISADDLDPSDEDVHSAIERLLGEVGRKIHAGRSRNDQVAAALRLYVQAACAEGAAALAAFAAAVLERAAEEAETPMPGYTHLQRAIPVTLGHHLLAWVEMLERDRDRLRFAAQQAAPSPLGAGALAGSTLPLPSPEHPMRNTIDAVSDRDFALDYLYAVTVCFTHLSRIGEEVVLWTTSEFGFARLPEGAATGSSMMPQKLNADVAELSRGKAGTAIGRLAGLLATVKGLPLAYNRDLQEDKQAVFAARADLRGALAALGVLVAGLAFDRERLAAGLRRPPPARHGRRRGAGGPGRRLPRRPRAGRRCGTRRQLPPTGRRAQATRRRRGGGRGGERALVVMKTPLPVSLKGRDLLRIGDLVPAEAEAIFELAGELKRDRSPRLPGLSLGLFFDQPSTRTRISFAVAAIQLGGGSVSLSPQEMQLSRGESLADTAHVLSRYLDALAIRVLSQQELEAWAAAAEIPVINALTAVEHPCQALADALTIRQRQGGLEGVRIAWVGDGTNVLVSLAHLAALTGMTVTAACPEGYEPPAETPLTLVRDPREAAADADVLVTDIWVSLGQEAQREARMRDLLAYRLDESLVALASPDAIVLHCLPAHPGEEISHEVLYGPHSAVWDEAENRLHIEKALLALLVG